ncbi:uncharacterized protein LOC124629845 isoform X2 [Helicoverpa zea]|uniref:uncharacterized protein LOC124629845 isoform X2 n=1 Tax=Helicoverpa zea TaxID=7113 RepID=UPI001F58E35E|nr:uncharacterized protein LOC124629845 isoform X2 [Helicoverpa zea]
MSDIKSLIKKRASIKAKLTQFSSYLNISKSCEQLSEVQIVEVEYRLNTIENLYDKYDVLQADMEEMVDDPSEQYAEREEFEKQYYSLVAAARQLISNARKQASGNSIAEVDVSCSKHTHKHNSIRLPKIDLPKFSGSYHDWLEFRDTFISIIHDNDSIDNINKLHYLRASLKGSASLIIDNLDFRSDNYDAAWKLLCDRYDNKRLLVNNHVQSLFNVQSISKESSNSLRHIVDTTNKNLRALATLGQPVEYWDTLIIYIMTCKLDQVTNREWEEHRNSLSEPPTLAVFIEFIRNRADLLETLEESKSLFTKGEGVHVNNIKQSKHSSGSSETSRSPLSCPMCQKDHFIFQCDKFKSLPVQSRISKAQTSNVCLNCLRPGHNIYKCKLGHCKYCREKHNTLLHFDRDTVVPNQPTSTLASINHLSTSRVVLLSTALVNVSDAEGNVHTARILLDNGSTTNLMSQELARKLNISTYTVESKVTGINDQSSYCTQGCSISLKSVNSEYDIDIDCYVVSKISSCVPNTYIDVHNINVPTNIVLADPQFYVPSSIDILVGAEVFWNVLGTSRIDLGKSMPTLFESKLGWLLSGVIKQSNSSSHLCLLADTLQADLNCFSKPDSVSAKHTLTREERSCEELSLKSTYRDADGRFVISIPLKESPDILGDSYNMAKRRLALPYTLGLNWRCSSDTFSFSMSNATSSNIATKRKILSVIAQIFDSIGLVVPCIVEAKIIMQQLWLVKCSWDEPVPEHIQHPWDSFQNSLPFLNDFRIHRWITCESSSSVQLHVFTDASERAYGACLHVRSVSLSGEVHDGSLRCFLVETALHESPTSAHVRVSFGERSTLFARYPSPLLLKTLQRGEYVESSHSLQPRPRQVGATVTSWCNGSPRMRRVQRSNLAYAHRPRPRVLTTLILICLIVLYCYI